jgi:hypothetical protein
MFFPKRHTQLALLPAALQKARAVAGLELDTPIRETHSLHFILFFRNCLEAWFVYSFFT